MKHLLRWWLLAGAVLLVPYGLLALAGFLWLYQEELLWGWVVLTAVVSGVAWWAARWVARRAHQSRPGQGARPVAVVSDPRWSPAGQAAWAEVEAIAHRAEQQDLPLNGPEPLWNLLFEVLQAVARHFRPEQPDPVLEILVPEVLHTTELVAHDLRQAFSENVPGAHILTLGDLVRLRRWAGTGQKLYGVYRTLLRVARFGMNPLSAVLCEARDAAAAQLYHASVDQIKRWAVGYCVRKAGYYAIQLYSGQLVDEEAILSDQTARAQADAQKAREVHQTIEGEPLRITVLGQPKAGKSSLINALLGRQEAVVDSAPQARGAQLFLFQPEGQTAEFPPAVLVELPGYDAAPGSASPWQALQAELLQSDLILWVVAANSATRLPDRRLLEELRSFYLARPQRIPPAVVLAVTQIDRLRPWDEWAPPYDLAQPTGPKAQSIAQALQAVREDLGVDPETPVVPVCSRSDRLYNVQEGLWPALLRALPQAQRVRYLRVLRAYHEEAYWKRLWRQSLNSGRLLLGATTRWLRRRQ